MQKPLPQPILAKKTAKIPLGGQRGIGLFVRVDLIDLPRVRHRHWHANVRKRSTTIYAQTNIKRAGRTTTVQMHKLLRPRWREVDHWNGDGLDNRRRNLRAAGPRRNKQNRRIQTNNRSGFRGVNRHAQTGLWMARIGNGSRSVRIYLGCFATPEAAARAYDREARRRFGRFARFNFPRKGEQSASRRR